MQKLKVISTAHKLNFEEEVNKFLATKEIVIISQKIDTVATRTTLNYVAYFFYMGIQDYMAIQKANEQRENNKPKNAPKPASKKAKSPVKKPQIKKEFKEKVLAN